MLQNIMRSVIIGLQTIFLGKYIWMSKGKCMI